MEMSRWGETPPISGDIICYFITLLIPGDGAHFVRKTAVFAHLQMMDEN